MKTPSGAVRGAVIVMRMRPLSVMIASPTASSVTTQMPSAKKVHLAFL